MSIFGLFILLLVAGGGDKDKNPWIEKAKPIIARAEASGSIKDLADGLDAAYRADDWAAGCRLAERAATAKDDAGILAGRVARALWRGGRINAAEDALTRLPAKRDTIGLGVLITAASATGDEKTAFEAGAELEKQPNLSATDLIYVMGVHIQQNKLEDMVSLVRRIEKAINPENGYPESFAGEQISGLDKFFEKVGSTPLNQITNAGEATMRVAPLINLPLVDATINGHGPYRFILDTGGSIMISLDSAIAEEIGLKTITDGTIRGVSGKDTAGQALIDSMQIGDIVVKRGLARVFNVSGQTMGACDGILGTGVFGEGRMTVDFMKMKLTVQPSSADAAPGTAIDVRIVGDSKLIVPITINEKPGLGLLDSGADVAAIAPSTLRRLYPSRKFAEVSAPMAGVGTDEAPTISLSEGVDLKIGPREYRKFSGVGLDVLDKTLSPMLGVQIDALLGMPIFRSMKSFTIDLKRCRMWIDWLPDAEEAAANPASSKGKQ